MRQLSPAEGGDRLVDDRVGTRQAELEAPALLALEGGSGELRLGLEGEAGFGAMAVVEKISASLLRTAYCAAARDGFS